MCLTCGCDDAHRRVGGNLTFEDVRNIAVENSTTVDQVLRVMAATAAHDHARHDEEYSRMWSAETMSSG